MGTNLFQILRVLAPLAGILAAIIAVQAWWARGYSPTGHASEHFSSATVVFGIAFMLSAVVWALPSRIRRQPALWVLVSLVAVAAVVNAQGNLQVVDAIGNENWSLDDVASLGPIREGFDEGHARAELGGLAGVVAAGSLIVWLGARRVISRRLCLGAVVACVLVPYWIFPGFGLVIVAGVLVTRRVRRDLSRTAQDQPSKEASTKSEPWT
jgi:hypothetical protein